MDERDNLALIFSIGIVLFRKNELLISGRGKVPARDVPLPALHDANESTCLAWIIRDGVRTDGV
ncbi:hypothetical protein SAMN04487785_102381 [Dyella jiangningensis]|nr:hypothetical protein BDW41_102380 [Dyella sp. AtDHG13]SDJ53891.1 hypothetical protein SAMN04487785_102381 [Dyella jiangningensis]